MPKINYQRPFLYPYQTAILDSKARYTVTLAATKCGKTASHIVWLFEKALECKANHSVWWIAPTFGQAKIAYNRMKVQITDKNLFKANETNLIITLITGAKIEFKTAEKPDNLYGDDVYAAVFDEFTRAREAAWFALRSTLTATGGRCKFIGNAKDNKNWGNKLANTAKSNKSLQAGGEYEFFKITAYDAANAGMITKDGRPFIEEIESAKNDLPPSVFAELYLAEPSENGSHPFGLKFIELSCQQTLSSNPTVCFGIDLGKKSDYCSVVGFDQWGMQSYYDTWNKKNWQVTIDKIKTLPDVTTRVDATGLGDVVVDQIKSFRNNTEGYIFTQGSKQRLMEGLELGFHQRKIIIADDGDTVNGTGRLRNQLEKYETIYTRMGVSYSAPEGDHDDDVCALALAWESWKFADIQGAGPSVW